MSEEDDDCQSLTDDEKNFEMVQEDEVSCVQRCALDEDHVCPICLSESIGQWIGIPDNCNHAFCADCILEWSKNSKSCPIDRLVFSNVSVYDKDTSVFHHNIEVSPTKKQCDHVDTIACQICQSPFDEDTLLLCDACDQGYHCACLSPPLDEVPHNEWFCPSCRNVVTAEPDVEPPPRLLGRTIATERVRAEVYESRLRRSNAGDLGQQIDGIVNDILSHAGSRFRILNTPCGKKFKRKATEKPKRKKKRQMKRNRQATQKQNEVHLAKIPARANLSNGNHQSLLLFGSDAEFDEYLSRNMEETSCLLSEKHRQLSASALRFRMPLPSVVTLGHRISNRVHVPPSPIPDLLSDIISRQEMLTMPSSRICIQRNGTLQVQYTNGLSKDKIRNDNTNTHTEISDSGGSKRRDSNAKNGKDKKFDGYACAPAGGVSSSNQRGSFKTESQRSSQSSGAVSDSSGQTEHQVESVPDLTTHTKSSKKRTGFGKVDGKTEIQKRFKAGHKIQIKRVTSLPPFTKSKTKEVEDVYDPFSPTEDDNAPINLQRKDAGEKHHCNVYDPFEPTTSDEEKKESHDKGDFTSAKRHNELSPSNKVDGATSPEATALKPHQTQSPEIDMFADLESKNLAKTNVTRKSPTLLSGGTPKKRNSRKDNESLDSHEQTESRSDHGSHHSNKVKKFKMDAHKHLTQSSSSSSKTESEECIGTPNNQRQMGKRKKKSKSERNYEDDTEEKGDSPAFETTSSKSTKYVAERSPDENPLRKTGSKHKRNQAKNKKDFSPSAGSGMETDYEKRTRKKADSQKVRNEERKKEKRKNKRENSHSRERGRHEGLERSRNKRKHVRSPASSVSRSRSRTPKIGGSPLFDDSQTKKGKRKRKNKDSTRDSNPMTDSERGKNSRHEEEIMRPYRSRSREYRDHDKRSEKSKKINGISKHQKVKTLMAEYDSEDLSDVKYSSKTKAKKRKKRENEMPSDKETCEFDQKADKRTKKESPKRHVDVTAGKKKKNTLSNKSHKRQIEDSNIRYSHKKQRARRKKRRSSEEEKTSSRPRKKIDDNQSPYYSTDERISPRRDEKSGGSKEEGNAHKSKRRKSMKPTKVATRRKSNSEDSALRKLTESEKMNKERHADLSSDTKNFERVDMNSTSTDSSCTEETEAKRHARYVRSNTPSVKYQKEFSHEVLQSVNIEKENGADKEDLVFSRHGELVLKGPQTPSSTGSMSPPSHCSDHYSSPSQNIKETLSYAEEFLEQSRRRWNERKRDDTGYNLNAESKRDAFHKSSFAEENLVSQTQNKNRASAKPAIDIFQMSPDSKDLAESDKRDGTDISEDIATKEPDVLKYPVEDQDITTESPLADTETSNTDSRLLLDQRSQSGVAGRQNRSGSSGSSNKQMARTPPEPAESGVPQPIKTISGHTRTERTQDVVSDEDFLPEDLIPKYHQHVSNRNLIEVDTKALGQDETGEVSKTSPLTQMVEKDRETDKDVVKKVSDSSCSDTVPSEDAKSKDLKEDISSLSLGPLEAKDQSKEDEPADDDILPFGTSIPNSNDKDAAKITDEKTAEKDTHAVILNPTQILNFIGLNPQQKSAAQNAILSIAELSKHLQLDKVMESEGKAKGQGQQHEDSPFSVDNIESSAVAMYNKDKRLGLLKKVQFQEAVAEEAKLAIKPYYESREISKTEYKEIMKRAVNKICSTEKSMEVNSVKIRRLIRRYIQNYQEKSNFKKEKMRNKLNTQIPKSEKRRSPSPPPYQPLSPHEAGTSLKKTDHMDLDTPSLLKRRPRQIITLPDLPLPPPPPPPPRPSHML